MGIYMPYTTCDIYNVDLADALRGCGKTYAINHHDASTRRMQG
jgi:hypothetical protein